MASFQKSRDPGFTPWDPSKKRIFRDLKLFFGWLLVCSMNNKDAGEFVDLHLARRLEPFSVAPADGLGLMALVCFTWGWGSQLHGLGWGSQLHGLLAQESEHLSRVVYPPWWFS